MDFSRRTVVSKEIEASPQLPPLDDRGDTLFLAIGRFLWSRRVLLVKAAATGLVIGVIVSLLIPNKYRATTQLMPPDRSSSSGTAMLAALTAKAGIPVGLAGDLLGAKSSGALFVGVMRSRTLEDRLIDRFDLRKVYGTKTYMGARKRLGEQTDIIEERKTGIISITVEDRDRYRAAKMGQAYVEELDRLVAELTTSAAHRERVFLEQRLQVVKQELDNSARELSQFSSENTAIDIKEQAKAMVDAAATLQGQLIAAQSQLSGLEQIYSDQNVRVRTMRARIVELQHQLEKMGGTDSTGREIASGGPYPTIRQLPILGLKYSDLYRRTKIAETVFETRTQQYELAKVEEAKEIPSVRVLDVAQPPEKKSSPNRTVICIAAAIAGLLLSALFVVLGELWREIDDSEPHKLFLQQVSCDIRPYVQRPLRSMRRKLLRPPANDILDSDE